MNIKADSFKTFQCGIWKVGGKKMFDLTLWSLYLMYKKTLPLEI